MGCSRFTALLGALLAMGCEAPGIAPAGGVQAERIATEQLAPLAARVEAVRELRFRRRVPAFWIPQEAVRGLLERELNRSASPEEIARENALAAALGLVPAGFDLRAALLGFQADSVSGFFAPLDGHLYLVRGAMSAAGQSEEALVVHELTHALQAQRPMLFDALLGLQGDDDLALAVGALLEGEATFVELADRAARSGIPRPTPSAFAAEFSVGALAPGLPRVVAEQVVAPYPLGYALADAIMRRGGVRALDEAHENPPLSSEELLHPERYLDPGKRRPVAELARDPDLPGCDPHATNSYGELALRSWLRELGAADEASAVAADGWDGDRAFALRCGGREGSGWLIQADDPAQARELASSLRVLARALDDLSLRLDERDHRVLVSGGLTPAERGQLLALPELRRSATLRAYLAAHPEVRARARQLRR